jgi:hypothetical protein
MKRMAPSSPKDETDIEIRYQDGTIVRVELKQHGRGVTVRDLLHHTEMHISGASAASVGAASIFGWYVRSKAPWTEHFDNAGLTADWLTVGDDLWRAAGQVASGMDESDSSQSRLFDPADLGKQGAGHT